MIIWATFIHLVHRVRVFIKFWSQMLKWNVDRFLWFTNLAQSGEGGKCCEFVKSWLGLSWHLGMFECPPFLSLRSGLCLITCLRILSSIPAPVSKSLFYCQVLPVLGWDVVCQNQKVCTNVVNPGALLESLNQFGLLGLSFECLFFYFLSNKLSPWQRWKMENRRNVPWTMYAPITILLLSLSL